ncbi:MAG: STAS domain-containing protein [Lachnospiraceae bacterium]|nr:STAS domain-containing protein [Lachnospiraceae bacterium]
MNTEEIRNGEEIILKVSGKVDAITGDKFQQEILQSFRKTTGLVIDFTEVVFISSAGLRGLLIGQKTANSKGGYMKVRGASPSVMQIFKTTGFDKMLTIE